MKETIINIIFTVVGLMMVIFQKYFGKFIIVQQNKFWGFHFGDREAKITGTISVIVGIGFIILGLISILKNLGRGG